MTYRQQYELAKQQDISPYQLVAAAEVEFFMGNLLTDDEFEKVCKYVFDWCNATAENEATLCSLIRDGVDSEEIDINGFGDYEAEEKITDYLNEAICRL